MSAPYTLWILGAADAEMTAIESLLRECGQPVHYALAPVMRRDPSTGRMVAAVDEAGAPIYQRVAPGQPAVSYEGAPEVGPQEIIAIEVAGPWGPATIDHHDEAERASWGPDRFLQASSLGQVIERLAQASRIPAAWARTGCIADGSPVGYLHQPEDAGGAWAVLVEDGLVAFLPTDLVLAAAADHCPAAAVAGLCPGVDPGAFAPFLAESKRRQYFPTMSPEDFARELEISRATLRMAPPCVALDTLVPTQIMGPGGDWYDAGMQPAGYVRDLRHLEPGTVPAQGSGECYPAEFLVGIVATLFEGIGFICRIRRRDGRLALRSNGHGQGTLAGTRPAEVFLSDPAAFGCGPRFPAGQDASYGNPVRGYFGGLLVD